MLLCRVGMCLTIDICISLSISYEEYYIEDGGGLLCGGEPALLCGRGTGCRYVAVSKMSLTEEGRLHLHLYIIGLRLSSG